MKGKQNIGELILDILEFVESKLHCFSEVKI